MKKILVITIALIVLNLSSVFALTVHIQIGEFRTCDYFGICDIWVTQLSKHNIELSPDRQTLIININGEALAKDQPDKVKYFKGQNAVTFEKSWTSPEAIYRGLKETTPIIIRPGKYPLSQNQGIYTIRIPITYKK